MKAHIFVCSQSYALWKMLEGWQECAGSSKSPRTILAEIKRFDSVDAVLPIVDGPLMRLRCVLELDEALKTPIDRLGLRSPKRLRPRIEVRI